MINVLENIDSACLRMHLVYLARMPYSSVYDFDVTRHTKTHLTAAQLHENHTF